MNRKQKASIASTYKSKDTEEWLDIYFTRPIGFLWAKLFDRFDVHPNVVTVFSIILGFIAGLMFYYPDLWHNVIGTLLLVWANFYDSADGQLARMTGKKTRWGRILDGFAGDVWFVTIYVALVFRLWFQPIPYTSISWGIIILLVAAFSGIFCHAHQCQLADYYRNIHLFFVRGEAHSELDNSEQQKLLLAQTPKKGNFWWRIFLKQYIKYVKNQERQTPHFQKLIRYIQREYKGNIPLSFRDEFRSRSLPLMKYANIVTFNCRAITLYITCILNVPWLYFIIEIVVFSSIAYYMNYQHENMCAILLDKLEKGHFEMPSKK